MSDDATQRLKNLMMRRGGLIIFGPQYLEATMALVDVKKNERAVFSGAKIEDLPIPETLMLRSSLIFCHSLTWCRGRGVTSAELKDWSARLLEGIAFKPAFVPGLSPAEIAEPVKRFAADEKTNDLNFLVQWGPVPSRHCVEVARALERAYARLS
ncbi:MAG TPA: hypothetical protein VH309_12685 [Elusimicrobiota bacterium]|jgi:hypothetical protein|nr:hypothetical protein [Elusimicrobiota bacterium]